MVRKQTSIIEQIDTVEVIQILSDLVQTGHFDVRKGVS